MFLEIKLKKYCGLDVFKNSDQYLQLVLDVRVSPLNPWRLDYLVLCS